MIPPLRFIVVVWSWQMLDCLLIYSVLHCVGMLDNVTSLAYQAYYRLTNYTLTGNHRKVSV
jgi:hypothetical protein